MARGVMRRKLAALCEALDCSFFTEEHAFVLSMMLDNIDHYSAQITVLDQKIAAMCEPYKRQVAQLDQIPGFGVKNAQDLTGEIGAGMSAFPAAGHLSSWARVAPRPKESGGRRKGGSATGKETRTPARHSARPPPPPAAPRPSPAPGSAAWSATCPRRKPR
jgi:transposase